MSSMKAPCFLDTNILLYAAAGKVDEPRKFEVASRIVREAQFSVSAQVIGEFYAVSRKKFAEVLSLADVHAWVESLIKFPFVEIDLALIRSAMFHAERFKIAFWDAALIAASERLSVPVLYTEDLSHGQKYGMVTAINPFRAN